MKGLFATLAAVLAVASAAPANLAKSIADNLSIRVGVQTNHPNAVKPTVDCGKLGADWGVCGIAYFEFTNKGSDVTDKEFSIYFHSIRRVLKVESEEFSVEHITGDLHKLVPSENFKALKAGKTRVPYIFEYWMVFATDFIPRYWVVDKDGSFEVVANTDTAMGLSKFSNPIMGDNYKPTPNAKLPLYDVTKRFSVNEDTKMLDAAEIAMAIVPTPMKVVDMKGTADLAMGINIVAKGLPAANVKAVEMRLEKLGVKKNAKGYMVEVSVAKDLPEEAAKAEGYTLKVMPEGAKVVGYDATGAFYGLQSLASLVKVGSTMIPAVDVMDAPRFGFRGQHFDVGRNFHSKKVVLRLLDHMAAYKLNRFHFHLSDDEGWRLEIPGLPELTEIGSQRCFDLTETKCILPQLGSGPTTKNFGSGFFTRAEYMEILKYASARCIEVFPEFDMPGHSRAAVMSMEARYRKLSAAGKETEANMYRLMDPDDVSKFFSVQYYDKRSQINACLPSTINFITKLVKEVVAMHKEAKHPLKTWHFGADEAHNILLGGGYVDASLPEENKTGKGQVDVTGLSQPLEGSPVCQKFIAEKNLKITELIGYLAIEVSKILEKNDIKTFMAWQDGMTSVNASMLKTDMSMLNFWDTLFWGGADTLWKWAAKGYDLVLSLPDYLYLDFPQENNPKESGYYWGQRHQSIRHVFGFAPENLPQNAETTLDRGGEVFQITSAPLPAGKTVKDVVKGMQGMLWSEVVRTDEQAEYMMYPRMIAVAERAWHKASWELEYVEGRVFNYTSSNYVDKEDYLNSWTRFANVLGQRELPKLAAMDVNYRVPVPGAVKEETMLKANIDMPGIPIQCSLDNKEFVPYDPKGVPIPADVTKMYVRAGMDGHYSRSEVVEV